MLINKTEIRVRYADTDQMHFVYNGKYLEYFEVGRTEMLREIGLAYSVIENKGYQLPVLETFVKFISPAFYDDILTVESFMKECPSFKIRIDYKIYRKINNSLVAEGYTEHVFIKEQTKKPSRLPFFFTEIVDPFYQH
ncbi:MAG: thioesterase family protein [Ignavibacteriaceae bacterium]|jgi:acyl-CoA thioester hydrolase